MENGINLHTQIQNNSNCIKEILCNKPKTVDGINSWTVLLFSVYVLHFVINNYISYGIIKDPIEMTFDFIEFMKINWWCFVVPVFSLLLQILLCFLIEKLLAKEILKGNIGMALHVWNSLLTFNVCAVICSMYDLNPVAGVVIVTHIFLMSVKFWSYAFVNKKYRDAYKKNLAKPEANEEVDKTAKGTIKTIKYPENITLKNLYQFVLYTPTCVYHINVIKWKPRNYKLIARKIIEAIFVLYSSAFIIYQYIAPEARNVVSYINTEQYLKMLTSMLILVLPVNIVWLLFFYRYCFKFYLPMMGLLGGTADITLATDWYNSENTTIFWTKWNYQVHIWLKECFFLPLIQMGYSKKFAAVSVGVISGILHEYLISVPCRGSFGLPTAAMLAQIPLASVTSYVHKKFGGKYGNILVWMSFVLGHPISAVAMYYSYVKVEHL